MKIELAHEVNAAGKLDVRPAPIRRGVGRGR